MREDGRDATGTRLLHVFRYFRPDFTGEGLYFEKLAPLLAERGIRSEVVVAAHAPGEASGPRPGIEAVHRLVDPGRPRAWGNRALLRWLAGHARRFDVMHLHCMVDRLFIPQLVGRAAGHRVVQSFTLDDSPGWLVDGYQPVFRPVARLLVGAIDHGVAISPRLAEDALRVMAPHRLRLIPQAVELHAQRPDLARRQAARERFGFAADQTVLLLVGGLCARKGVMELLEGFARVHGAFPAAHLLLVGPDLEPAYADALRTRAAGLRVNRHAKGTPYRRPKRTPRASPASDQRCFFVRLKRRFSVPA
jgi:glycosyltransferase involved in cell wall biosynthesis